MTSRWEQRYWSVDAPGLDAAGASKLAECARRLSAVRGPTAVDPNVWLTQHLDQDTVVTMVRAMSLALETADLDPDEAWAIQQLADDLRSWLDSSNSPPAQD